VNKHQTFINTSSNRLSSTRGQAPVKQREEPHVRDMYPQLNEEDQLGAKNHRVIDLAELESSPP
jgi:hypothetical protein